MTKKVNFLIAGAQKAGTTALDAYIRAHHPSICMANEKEVHFFDNEAHFATASVDYSSYHQAFNPTFAHQLLGESTPIYMYWQEAPQRIWQYNPDMKIILILRNPIERAFSHWNMERGRNTEQLDFWDAIVNEQQRCKKAWPLQHRVYSYLDRGFYVRQLARFWRYFPKGNTLILRHEDLKDNPQQAVNEVFEFLGVEKLSRLDKKTVFSIPYPQAMSHQEKAFLLDVFMDEIIKLEQLLGWDCRNWIK